MRLAAHRFANGSPLALVITADALDHRGRVGLIFRQVQVLVEQSEVSVHSFGQPHPTVGAQVVHGVVVDRIIRVFELRAVGRILVGLRIRNRQIQEVIMVIDHIESVRIHLVDSISGIRSDERRYAWRQVGHTDRRQCGQFVGRFGQVQLVVVEEQLKLVRVRMSVELAPDGLVEARNDPIVVLRPDLQAVVLSGRYVADDVHPLVRALRVRQLVDEPSQLVLRIGAVD